MNTEPFTNLKHKDNSLHTHKAGVERKNGTTFYFAQTTSQTLAQEITSNQISNAAIITKLGKGKCLFKI